MNRTTIKELGLKLPIGSIKDGKLAKDFTLRPYKGKVDRYLNIYREANEGRSIAHLAAKFLSLILESIGGVSFPLKADGDSSEETEFAIHNLYFADFIYAYVYSRIVNVGELITVNTMCQSPTCKYKGELQADLWTTDVTVVESPADIFTWITLRNGLKLPNGKLAKKIKIQPVKYQALLLSGNSQSNINGLAYAQLRESIAEVEGAPDGFIIQDSDIDELSKIDLLMLDRKAGEQSAGIDMRTTVTCPDCGRLIKNTLQWAFDPFFDSSVLLETAAP